MAADELGGGFHNDVGAVLQRAEQVRGGEGVVHDHRQVVLVGDGGDGLEVGQVGVRVAEGLEVDELGSHDVVAGLGDVAHRVFHGGRAGRDGQARGAAFEGRDAVFEHALGGVGQTAVDVARVRQSEAGLGVVEVVEDVAGGRVNRHCAGGGGRVGLLLADVQLQGFKTVLLVVLGHGILLGCARSRGFFLATRLPCSGGWRGVGYEVTTLGPRGAS